MAAYSNTTKLNLTQFSLHSQIRTAVISCGSGAELSTASVFYHTISPSFRPIHPPFPRPLPLVPRPSSSSYPYFLTPLSHHSFHRPRPLAPCPSPIFYLYFLTPLSHHSFHRLSSLVRHQSFITAFLVLLPSSFPSPPRSLPVTHLLALLFHHPLPPFFPSPLDLVPLLPVRHPSFSPAFPPSSAILLSSPITPRSPSVTIFLSPPSRPPLPPFFPYPPHHFK